MKTRINSNYNKKVLVRGNSLSDVNTLTENEMMLYTKQKDNEPVTKVVPSKIITKINGETKSYKVGGTKIIKNVVTSFRGKDVCPIYIHSANKLKSIRKSEHKESNNTTSVYYDGSYLMNIDNLLKKKTKRFYLLFYIPDLGVNSFIHMNLFFYLREDDKDLLSSVSLNYNQGEYYNISYLGHDYALWEIDITDKKNIIVNKVIKRNLAISYCLPLDGTYYFYSPQKHKYLTLDTRFTGDKSFNSFYLFEGLVDLDRIYREGVQSPRLYIPIEKIRKTNHCNRTLKCSITVPSSEDWSKEAAPLIEAKLNYRNYTIRGFNSTIKPIVEVKFHERVPSLDNKKISELLYYEGIEFRLYNNTLPDSDSKNYSLGMKITITVMGATISGS